jgi:hypothetical protein
MRLKTSLQAMTPEAFREYVLALVRQPIYLGSSTICVQRNSAITRPVASLLTTASQTCVCRPRCAGMQRQLTRSPTRADERKFDLSSIVVNDAPAGMLLPQPIAAQVSASAITAGAHGGLDGSSVRLGDYSLTRRLQLRDTRTELGDSRRGHGCRTQGCRCGNDRALDVVWRVLQVLPSERRHNLL